MDEVVEDTYSSCFKGNQEERAWLNRVNKGVSLPAELVMHKMTFHRPECRGRCDYSKSCAELWDYKYL